VLQLVSSEMVTKLLGVKKCRDCCDFQRNNALSHSKYKEEMSFVAGQVKVFMDMWALAFPTNS